LQSPTRLDLAHQRLDAAVSAAYGWPADLTDDEILSAAGTKPPADIDARRRYVC
jgi:hypothetical protein